MSMKKKIFLPLLLAFCSISVLAQGKPFNNLNTALKNEGSFFVGFKEVLSEAFNEDRKTLADNFESELWKYLGNDIDRHYYFGLFLVTPKYLYGNTPQPELALKIWQRGIELTKKKSSLNDAARRTSLLIVSAVLAEKIGKSDDAKKFKAEADAYIAAKPEAGNYDLKLTAHEICIYRSIGNAKKDCVEPRATDLPKNDILSAGTAIAGKFVFAAIPVIPKEMKGKDIEGSVLVEILVDETGKVISAKGIKGLVEFYPPAEKAASLSKFRVSILGGKPVKMSGILRYTFYKDGRINMF